MVGWPACRQIPELECSYFGNTELKWVSVYHSVAHLYFKTKDGLGHRSIDVDACATPTACCDLTLTFDLDLWPPEYNQVINSGQWILLASLIDIAQAIHDISWYNICQDERTHGRTLNSKLTCQNTQLFTWHPHSALNLGFIFDECLTFSDQITSLSKACYYHIRQLRCIRPYFDWSTACTITTSVVHSKRDCDNSLYYKLPKCQLSRIQQIQNSLARTVVYK